MTNEVGFAGSVDRYSPGKLMLSNITTLGSLSLTGQMMNSSALGRPSSMWSCVPFYIPNYHLILNNNINNNIHTAEM